MRACGLGSLQAIRNWKPSLETFLGKTYVDQSLDQAGQIGRMEAEGKDPTNDRALASLARSLHSLNIETIGREYRRTSQARSNTGTSPSQPKRRAT
jgi:hypothetical protein